MQNGKKKLIIVIFLLFILMFCCDAYAATLNYNFNATNQGKYMWARLETGFNDNPPPANSVHPQAMSVETDITTDSSLDADDTDKYSMDMVISGGEAYYLIIMNLSAVDKNSISLLNVTIVSSTDSTQIKQYRYIWNNTGTAWYQCDASTTATAEAYHYCSSLQTGYEFTPSDMINASGYAHFLYYGSDGTYYISQKENGEWKQKYMWTADPEYSTKDFKFTKDRNSQIRIQVRQKDIEFADIDSVIMNSCNEKISPVYAKLIEKDKYVTKDILENDNDVVVVSNMTLELFWDIPKECNDNTVSITANEYGKKRPFEEKNLLVSLDKIQNKDIVIDGYLPEYEKEFDYKFYWEPDTGHPDGYTYLNSYVNDGYLYFTLDITMDNSDDYGEDYLKIKIGNKEFKIDDYTTEYGKCGFQRTDKVAYKHQVCEVKIPLWKINLLYLLPYSNKISQLNNINYDLEYYGTGGVGRAMIIDYVKVEIVYDDIYPNVTNMIPADNFKVNGSNLPIVFAANISDDANLKNASLWSNWSGTFRLNESLSKTNKENYTNWSMRLNDGSYLWNIQVCDSMGQCNFTNANRTVTVDATAPTITVVYPIDYQSFTTNSNININFTATDNFIGVDSCWWTNNSGVSNYSLASCDNNITVTEAADGNYEVRIYSNDSLNNIGTSLIHYTISTAAPAVNLNYPTNDLWMNHINNLWFNVTATDSDGLKNCSLWGNWSGSFVLNQTNTTTITSGQMYNITLNLTEGHYKYNFLCADSNGLQTFSPTNFTFGVDITKPIVNITTITTMEGSQTFTFKVNNTDNLYMYTCKYSVYNSSGNPDSAVAANTSISCVSTNTATVSAYKSYNLTVCARDRALNEICNSSEFTVSPSPPAVPPTGGGAPTIIEQQIFIGGNATWRILSEYGTTDFKFQMNKGSSREKDILLVNDDVIDLNVTLRCEGDLCKYVELENYNLNLPVGQNIQLPVEMAVSLPDTIEDGEYKFNIIGTDQVGLEKVLTVEVTVGVLGLPIEVLNKFGASFVVGTLKIPYILVFLFIFVIVFLLTNFIFLAKYKFSVAISLIISLILATIPIVLI